MDKLNAVTIMVLPQKRDCFVRPLFCSVFLAMTVISLLALPAYCDIKLKVAVVNPSETEEQTTPVRYDLPKGITPEDITDIGTMDLNYDFAKAGYYLYKVVKLKPSERVVLEIHLRDVWLVPQKELDFLKSHTKELAAKLEKTKHAKTGATLAKKIIDQLDEMTKKEANQNMTIGEHINLYYENMGILIDVKNDIGMLENLVLDVGGIVESRVQVPSTLAVPIQPNYVGRSDIVEMTIRASNPSKTAKQVTNVKYVLPAEVAPRYVVDKGDLEMGYDFPKQSFYVYKDSVILDPGEVKTFVIKIADIWRIPGVETDALKTHTANLMLLLKGTDYFAQAGPIADRITREIDDIKRTQSLKASPAEHIAYYRKNLIAMAEVKSLVSQLEKLVSQSGASVGVTIRDAEAMKGGGEKEKRARGYAGIDYIVQSIFKGKAPTVATTWKMIYMILAFMAILTALFFALWYNQAKRLRKREEELKRVEREGASESERAAEEPEKKE